MAFDTVRTNKMRSGLTVLGVVIGITSIVAMTSLIRGFDQSLQDSISTLGPNTIFISAVRLHELRERRRVSELLQAAEPDDLRRRAIEEQATLLQYGRHRNGRRRPGLGARSASFIGIRRHEADHRLRHDGEIRRTARAFRISAAGSSAAPKCRIGTTSWCWGTRRTSCFSAPGRSIRSARRCAWASSGSRSSVCIAQTRRHRQLRFGGRTISSSSRTPRYQRVFGSAPSGSSATRR